MTNDIVSTRFSRSNHTDDSSGSSLLVRIYPVNGIEPPLELSGEPLLIGRDLGCSLTLHDDSVSRRHATIEPLDSSYVVSDLGSTNGTYINEQRVSGSRRLEGGDRIRFGNQIFKYLSSDRIEAQYHEVIFKLMTTDGMTSVHNKRYLLEALEQELQQSQRTGTPLCVMLLDLDKFKTINDTYGHLAGDAVLIEFARRAKTVLRSGDLLARYGGEEFVMLLSRTGLDYAAQIAERVRVLTAATPVEFEGMEIPVTVSIGIACDYGTCVRESSELLARADDKLYVAKIAGRNQVQM